MARYPVKGRDLFRFKSVFAGKFRATVVHPAQIFDVKMDFQRVNFIQRHIMSRVQRSRPVGQPRMMLPAARARSRTASFRRSCTVRLTRSETSSSVRCEGRTSSFPSMTSIQSRSSCSGSSTGSSKSSTGDADQSFAPNGPGRLTVSEFSNLRLTSPTRSGPFAHSSSSISATRCCNSHGKGRPSSMRQYRRFPKPQVTGSPSQKLSSFEKAA